jgi:hypothetical protein
MQLFATIVDFVVTVGACFGLAYIVGFSVISLPVRNLLGGIPELRDEDRVVVPAQRGLLGTPGEWLCKLLECPACFGFWTGALWGPYLVGLDAATPGLFNKVLLLGCMVAGSNFTVAKLTRLI